MCVHNRAEREEGSSCATTIIKYTCVSLKYHKFPSRTAHPTPESLHHQTATFCPPHPFRGFSHQREFLMRIVLFLSLCRSRSQENYFKTVFYLVGKFILRTLAAKWHTQVFERRRLPASSPGSERLKILRASGNILPYWILSLVCS